jgi:hypothetical protein
MRWGAVVAGAVLAGVVAQGCAESRRADGQPCLKDQDCLSGICSQLACASAPPVLDAEVDGPGVDAAVEAASEAGGADASADVAPDGPVDAPVDAPAQ